MAAAEDDKKKEQGKGFAGLSSLMSDVDTTLPPAAEKPTTSSAGAASGASRWAPQATPPKPKPVPQQPYKPPQQPGSGSSSAKWWIGIAAVIGVLWLIGQSNKNTSSPAPAYTPPSQTATPGYLPAPSQPQVPSPTSATSTDSDLMQDGDGVTYRVPSFRVPELKDSKRAARAAQQDARNLDAQVERQNNLLNGEKDLVNQQERQFDELGSEIEQERSSIDPSNQFELDSFNAKVHHYNTNRAQLRYRVNSFNTDVSSYNELVQRAQTLERRANQLVDIYNSKLEQYGTRQ